MLSVDIRFFFLDIECVSLTEPGEVTVICASRVGYIGDPICRTKLLLEVSCETLIIIS